MFRDLKRIQQECDRESFFIKNKKYDDLKEIDILKHNCFHLVNLAAKIARICEQEEHLIDLPMDVIKTEVIPDLIIYALQFANQLGVDVDKKFHERLEFVKTKYNKKQTLSKVHDYTEPAHSQIETKWGSFLFYVWRGIKGREPVALVTPNFDPAKPVMVRIHSECITGDNLGSLRCDCGEQKENSLRLISKSGNGLFIYHRQEGRGIGLFEKVRSYKLQSEGFDTYEANLKIGYKPDERDYDDVFPILNFFSIKEIILLTNNLSKVNHLKKGGIAVTHRIPMPGQVNQFNENYLLTKIKKMGHKIPMKLYTHYD